MGWPVLLMQVHGGEVDIEAAFVDALGSDSDDAGQGSYICTSMSYEL